MRYTINPDKPTFSTPDFFSGRGERYPVDRYCANVDKAMYQDRCDGKLGVDREAFSTCAGCSVVQPVK